MSVNKEEESEYKKGDSIKPMTKKPTPNISMIDEGMAMTYNSVNFKDKDAERMNSSKAMTGENEDFKVPITGMKSSSAYFNLGMALRGNLEQKAKDQGYKSLSDKSSKMKAERKAKRSTNKEIKEYKKNLN